MTEPHYQLDSDLDHWEVTLQSGETMHIRAHGVREADGHYVFVAFMSGSPLSLYELLRVPASAVEEVAGGWPTPSTMDAGG
jgi:hypothetical protein